MERPDRRRQSTSKPGDTVVPIPDAHARSDAGVPLPALLRRLFDEFGGSDRAEGVGVGMPTDVLT